VCAAVLERLPTDEFIVLCCDGVWDVLTNEECVDQIKKRSETGDDVQVMEGLLDRCLELGSRDNMTSCVIRLQPRAPPKYVVITFTTGCFVTPICVLQACGARQRIRPDSQ
jgi:Protein phosphatase 2C